MREIAFDVVERLSFEMPYVDEVWLFGSVARGQHRKKDLVIDGVMRKKSDLDIMCLTNSGFLPCTIDGLPLDAADSVEKVERYARDRYGIEVNVCVRNRSRFFEYFRDEGGVDGEETFRGNRESFHREVYRDRVVLLEF